ARTAELYPHAELARGNTTVNDSLDRFAACKLPSLRRVGCGWQEWGVEVGLKLPRSMHVVGHNIDMIQVSMDLVEFKPGEGCRIGRRRDGQLVVFVGRHAF